MKKIRQKVTILIKILKIILILIQLQKKEIVKHHRKLKKNEIHRY